MEIVEDRGDNAAYIKELELVIALYKPTQSALLIGVMTAILAEQFITCGRIDDAEGLLIDAYTLSFPTEQRGGAAVVTGFFGDLRKAQGCIGEAAELFEAAGKMFKLAGITPEAAKYDQRVIAMRMQIQIATSD